MTHRPRAVDPAAPRYTTVDAVKARMRIPDGNADFDGRITAAIVAAEHAIDAELGRSFPDLGVVLASGTYILRTATRDHDRPDRGEALTSLFGLRMSQTDLSARWMPAQIADDPVLNRAADVTYAWVAQPRGREVTMSVAALSDQGGWWQFTDTVIDGSLTDLGVDTQTDVYLMGTAVPTTIPIAVAEAATDTAVAAYKMGDAPFGSAGSDDFIGSLEVQETVRAAVRRSPTLVGYRVSWGVA